MRIREKVQPVKSQLNFAKDNPFGDHCYFFQIATVKTKPAHNTL